MTSQDWLTVSLLIFMVITLGSLLVALSYLRWDHPFFGVYLHNDWVWENAKLDAREMAMLVNMGAKDEEDAQKELFEWREGRHCILKHLQWSKRKYKAIKDEFYGNLTQGQQK